MIMSRFRELNLELYELYAVKVACTVLNGGSGSNAADLHNNIQH